MSDNPSADHTRADSGGRLEDRTEKGWPTAASAGLGAALLALWLPFFLLCLFAYPALDDFSESTWSSLWESQRDRYLGYTGRFAGTLLQALNPLHWDSLAAYRVGAGLRIALFAFCVHVFLCAMNRSILTVSPRGLLVLQTLVWTAFLSALPSPSQLFYWHSASVLYLFPLAVLLLLLALLVNQCQGRYRGPTASFALGAGFFVVAGTVEVLPLLVLTFAVPALARAWRRSPEWVRPLSIAVVATLAGLCINLLAPGNDVRQAQMDASSRASDLPRLASLTISGAGRSCVRWGSRLDVVVPALLVAPVFWRLGRRGLRLPHPVVIAGATILGLVVLYWAPLWGLGFTPVRVRNVALFAFVMGLFAFVAAATVRMAAVARGGRALGLGVLILVAIGTAVGVVRVPGDNKVILAYRELVSGTAASYERAEQRRADAIRAAEDPDVVVPPLETIAHSLVPKVVRLRHGGEDVLAEDPADWWGNNNYARYFGKTSLRVQQRGPNGRQ